MAWGVRDEQTRMDAIGTRSRGASSLTTSRARGDEPPDDSDPAPLIAKMGPMMAKIPIEAVELATGLHLIQGPGGNIAVLDGPDGLTVVDSGVPMRAKEIFETVKRVGGKPVSRLINTHWHFDHAGGNEVFARAGATVLATAATRKRLSTDQYTEVFKLTTPASPADRPADPDVRRVRAPRRRRGHPPDRGPARAHRRRPDRSFHSRST